MYICSRYHNLVAATAVSNSTEISSNCSYSGYRTPQTGTFLTLSLLFNVISIADVSEVYAAPVFKE
jgi:hypothetical protein